MERIGIVGIGNMGKWMAINLLKKGYTVTCYDIRPEAVKSIEEQGAAGAESLNQLAAASDVVFVMLLNMKQIESVVFAEDGLLGAMRPGSVLIITSTIAPEDAGMIYERTMAAGIYMIDAPVSGGPLRAQDGTMMIMVACPDELFDRCRDILLTIGSNATHVGRAAGMGQVVKAANQMLVYVNMAMTAEAILLAKRAGVDMAQFIDVIKRSLGNSAVFESKSQAMLASDFTTHAELNLVCKDLGIALAIGEKAGLDLHITKTANSLFSCAVKQGLGGKDYSAIIKVYDK